MAFLSMIWNGFSLLTEDFPADLVSEWSLKTLSSNRSWPRDSPLRREVERWLSLR
jgi:hypothetical protein